VAGRGVVTGPAKRMLVGSLFPQCKEEETHSIYWVIVFLEIAVTLCKMEEHFFWCITRLTHDEQ